MSYGNLPPKDRGKEAVRLCVYCEEGIRKGQGMSVDEGDFAHKKCFNEAQRVVWVRKMAKYQISQRKGEF